MGFWSLVGGEHSCITRNPKLIEYDLEGDTDVPIITDIQFTDDKDMDAIDELSKTTASGPARMAAIFL